MSAVTRPERRELAPGLDVSRVITGLWQVADMERDHGPLDPGRAAAALLDYAEAGFDTFDMADHYGSAEDIAGRLVRHLPAGMPRPTILTKWCPEPGPMTPEVVRAGIGRSLDRLGVDRIDLLQLHWWTYQHPGYLDAMRELAALRAEGRIAQLGLTNFDTDHLRLLVGHGLPVATNQVCFSLLDRRAGEAMSDFCLERGIGLLAYGTLAGGFLSERWVGRPEPDTIGDWSKLKYRRFIEAVGGWGALQAVLAALAVVARRHGVSVANVATRWVLEQPAVAAVIVGARLGEREHRADNLRLFALCARRGGSGADRRGVGCTPAAFPATAATSTGGRPSSPPPATSATIWAPCRLCSTASAVPGRDRPAARRQRQRLGADRGLQPGGAGRRPDPGQRHHRDPRRRRGGLPGRSLWPDGLRARQDRGQPRRARRLARRRGAHAHLRPGRKHMGAGRPCPRPPLRRRSARPTPWSRPS